VDAIARITPKAAFVIASGSLPAGVPADFYGSVAQASKGLGKVIVDTSGTSLKAALEVGVYLIKPNLREFQELAGIASANDASLIEAGRYLFDRHRIEIIALSMGSDGALLMSRNAGWRANGLPIEPASVFRRRRQFLGAMVWSLVSDGRLDMALRYGVAGGSAALLNPGTELCRVDDFIAFASEVVVTPIAAFLVSSGKRFRLDALLRITAISWRSACEGQ
jgi:6-phosphofructokinase 2